MTLTNLLNPYTYIGAAVVLAAIGGGFYYQDRQIHHYHILYNNEHDLRIQAETKIRSMTSAQNTQTKVTDANVIKVVQGQKEVQTITKIIHDAPEPADCKTPPLPKEVTDAF